MAEKHYQEIEPQLTEVLQEDQGTERFLVLHNDEVHTFDYVIETLIDVCEMDAVQAEQCTFLVHYKGKCDVKKGGFDFLRPYQLRLIDKELEATIE